MKVMLDEGAYIPERSHDTDGGIDLKAMHGQRVMPDDSAVFHTGVHVPIEIVDHLDMDTDRGTDGFGSTGR